MSVLVATIDDIEAVVERAIARHVSVRRLAWTVPEVATSLGTSPDSVRRLIRNGHLPLVPGMGQRQLIPVQALEQFVLAGASTSAGSPLPAGADGPSGAIGTDRRGGGSVSPLPHRSPAGEEGAGGPQSTASPGASGDAA